MNLFVPRLKGGGKIHGSIAKRAKPLQSSERVMIRCRSLFLATAFADAAGSRPVADNTTGAISNRAVARIPEVTCSLATGTLASSIALLAVLHHVPFNGTLICSWCFCS
jgi:hypothetical protein